jgi:protein TonB
MAEMFPRHIIAAGLALIITTGLFLVMHSLISMKGSDLDDLGPTFSVDFVRVKRDEQVNEKKRKMPEKKQLDDQPPPPPMNLAPNLQPAQELVGIDIGINVDLNVGDGTGFVVAQADTEIVPLVRIDPQYPIRAEERGIEGWVELEFTIGETGAVIAARVLNAKPKGIFDRSALRAIKRWKYNPKVEDGVAMEQPGVTVRLVFNLQDG